ncbi:MAG: putative metal-binding protein [Armatimonadetes bacterium]|jgi:copper chaperone CopZ|nr:putative metal-binding protein [Armatimonadota bacterium]
MKRFVLATLATGLLAVSAYAADVKVTGIHNCCGQCAKGINTALSAVGATNVNATSTEVTFSAADGDKAVKALFDAGYAGKVTGAKTPEVAKTEPTKALKLDAIHNCCGGCTTAIKDAVKPFGATTIKPKDTVFTITSDKDIDAQAVLKALREAGYNAKVVK